MYDEGLTLFHPPPPEGKTGMSLLIMSRQVEERGVQNKWVPGEVQTSGYQG